jgi:phage repressor protein C with HTH and peptisase S24 domain
MAEKKVTQEALASAVGYSSQATIANAIARGSLPKKLHKIAAVLGVRAEWIETGALPKEAGPVIAAPPSPPRDFSDRHEVSDTDFGLLQDVHLVMTDEELSALRTRAERLRRIAQEQLETVAAGAPRPNFGASGSDWKQVPSPLRRRRDDDQEQQA